jgi:3-deoxy-manno-octulosonate cytidylyltransferase (CMP-KDO synthetase)
MRVVAVIPARYASTRFPGKPLAPLKGKPMIQHVFERVQRCKDVHQVIVATEDKRILSAVQAFGGEAMMTSSDHFTGTDRVCEVARKVDAEIIVNVQGDEPLIDPVALSAAIKAVADGSYKISTLSVPIRSLEHLFSMNVVKVLTDVQKRALYFSRFPIPYSRVTAPADIAKYVCRQHVGVYVFERQTLFQFQSMPPCSLEKGESLEQLRALQAGIPIGVLAGDFVSIGVDTPDDLKEAEEFIK